MNPTCMIARIAGEGKQSGRSAAQTAAAVPADLGVGAIRERTGDSRQ